MRVLRWGRAVFSVVMIGLGVVLATGQAQALPMVVRQYWPAVLIVWGAAMLILRWRSREDMWAGTDYGTGLYVIRHRRRRPGQWVPGVSMIGLGVFFQIANLDPTSGVWFGPLAVIGLGAVSLLTSFGSPPRKDF
ncbi:MAG TPA: hypothetical protein VFF59_11145 [Anaerolineae bacterium]|nr:hypothetical protein [Anaerolineae bacterium]